VHSTGPNGTITYIQLHTWPQTLMDAESRVYDEDHDECLKTSCLAYHVLFSARLTHQRDCKCSIIPFSPSTVF